MTAYGGKVEAWLTLNATDFTTTLATAIKAIADFRGQFNGMVLSLKRNASMVGSAFKQMGANIQSAMKEAITPTHWMNGFNKFGQQSQTFFNNYKKNLNDFARSINTAMSSFSNRMGTFDSFTEYQRNMMGLQKGYPELSSQLQKSYQSNLLANSFPGLSTGLHQANFEMQHFLKNWQGLQIGVPKGLNAWQKLNAVWTQNANCARNVAQQWTNMGPQMNKPLEHIWKNQKAINNLNKQVMQAQGSFAATGRSFAPIATGANNANKGLKGLYSTSGKSNQAFRGLLKNFHLLRGAMFMVSMAAGMLVGMIGFQLFNALMTSVQASMQGNQEMRAYFKTLKYTTAEVESITRALDKMGNKFKKINKYAVGSIIANVATQAGLKAEEAEAMVEPAALVYDTFMRGGRTPQQAQLAIKEIAEGEFVRLSRETGVGKKDLIATGKWSGDLNDKVGMFEAINVIAHQKHWDQFAGTIATWEDAVNAAGNAAGDLAIILSSILLPPIIAITTGFSDLFYGIRAGYDALPSWGKFFVLVTVMGLVIGTFTLLLNPMYASIMAWYKNADAISTFVTAMKGSIVTLGPYILLIAGVATAIYALGDAYGWWTTAQQKHDENIALAKESLAHYSDEVSRTEGIVQKLKEELAQLTPGTAAYEAKLRELTAAQTDNKDAVTAQAEAEKLYQDAQNRSTDAINRNIEAHKRLLRALINYKLKRGWITEEDAVKELYNIDEIDSNIEQMDKETGSLNKKAGQIERTTKNDPKKGPNRYLTEISIADTQATTEKPGDWGAGMMAAAQASFKYKGGSKIPFDPLLPQLIPDGLRDFKFNPAGFQKAQDTIDETTDSTAKFNDKFLETIGLSRTDVEIMVETNPAMDTVLWILQKIICLIVGCSPGIIPAVQQLQGVWSMVWAAIWNTANMFIQPIVSALQWLWIELNKGWEWFYNTIVLPIYNALMLVWTYTVSLGTQIIDAFQSWLGPIWNKVNFYGHQIVNAWNWVKGALGAASNGIYSAVWGPISKLWGMLSRFWSFLRNPGGGVSMDAAVSLGAAAARGTAGPGAGPGPEIGLKVKGGAGGDFFNGATRHIANNTNNLISAGISNSHAGAGPGTVKYKGGVKLARDDILNTLFCDNPEECSAGWDMNWGSQIINQVKGWKVSVLGQTFSISEFERGGMGLFERLASALFNGIGYSFYFGDGKSNAQVIRDKSCNCYDGAQLICSLANAMGLPCSMVNGFWGSIAHTWAEVGGKTFDTTAFQKRHRWTGPAQGAGPGPSTSNDNRKTIEFNFTFNGDVHDKPELVRMIKNTVTKELNDVANALYY